MLTSLTSKNNCFVVHCIEKKTSIAKHYDCYYYYYNNKKHLMKIYLFRYFYAFNSFAKSKIFCSIIFFI